MFLQAIEFELLQNMYLPMAVLARQHAMRAMAAPVSRAGAAFLSGHAAADAMMAATRPEALTRAGNVFHHTTLLEAATAQAKAAGEDVVVARFRNGRDATLWPLRITRRHGITRASDLAAPLGQYGDVLGPSPAPHDIAALAAGLRARYRVDVLQTRRVRADSGLADALAAAGAYRHGAVAAPFINLSAFADFAAYEAQASRHTRRNRRQRRQKLEAAHGPIAFSVVPAHDAPEALRIAIAWKRQWLARQGRLSRVFDGGDNERALLRACAGGNAHLSLLHVGDALAAVELGFSNDAHYAAYLGSYDPALASFSVGQEQMLRTIAWCFTQNFARYDLLAPADAYKLAWARGNAVAAHDYCLPLSLRGKAFVAGQQRARAVMQRAFYALPLGCRQQALHWRARLSRR
jgi:CelD/BcsL family acetyltransferase involved in cellulose biosynthesis